MREGVTAERSCKACSGGGKTPWGSKCCWGYTFGMPCLSTFSFCSSFQQDPLAPTWFRFFATSTVEFTLDALCLVSLRHVKCVLLACEQSICCLELGLYHAAADSSDVHGHLNTQACQNSTSKWICRGCKKRVRGNQEPRWCNLSHIACDEWLWWSELKLLALKPKSLWFWSMRLLQICFVNSTWILFWFFFACYAETGPFFSSALPFRTDHRAIGTAHHALPWLQHAASIVHSVSNLWWHGVCPWCFGLFRVSIAKMWGQLSFSWFQSAFHRPARCRLGRLGMCHW